MATGRSLPAFQRVYIDGYNMSCYAMDAGEVGVDYPEYASGAMCDQVTGYLVGKPSPVFGPLVATFDNTATSGFHVLANAAQGVRRNITLAQGVRAAPAMGDDVFCAPMTQIRYKTIGDTIVTAKTDFVQDVTAFLEYDEFFGKLIHAYGAETGANSANTNVDNGAASTSGGWMMYHLESITGGGTATISIDDSANGTSWSGLSGATSGALSGVTSGIVQLGITDTVRRYLRWQLALAGGSTAATFVLSFMRGR